MSLLPHPTGLGETRVTIRRWQLHATDGNVTAAALLGVFEDCHLLLLQSKAGQASEADLLQPHTTTQLIQLIHGISSDKTVRAAVKLLQDKGFISTHPSPSSWDKTKYFLFHPQVAIVAIQEYQSTNGEVTHG